jgi:hypothetical protein
MNLGFDLDCNVQTHDHLSDNNKKLFHANAWIWSAGYVIYCGRRTFFGISMVLEVSWLWYFCVSCPFSVSCLVRLAMAVGYSQSTGYTFMKTHRYDRCCSWPMLRLESLSVGNVFKPLTGRDIRSERTSMSIEKHLQST